VLDCITASQDFKSCEAVCILQRNKQNRPEKPAYVH
jgi:hypothetical protein